MKSKVSIPDTTSYCHSIGTVQTVKPEFLVKRELIICELVSRYICSEKKMSDHLFGIF